MSNVQGAPAPVSINALPQAATVSGSENIPLSQQNPSTGVYSTVRMGLSALAQFVASLINAADLAGTGLSASGTTLNLQPAGAGEIGGVNSIEAVLHEWIAYIDANGLPHLSQPAFADISGNISPGQMGGGTGASNTTFWRGDGTWAVPSAGSVVGPGASTVGHVALFNNVTGTLLSDSGVALGSIATQAANNVTITGGAINTAAIGGTTKAAGAFTTLTATGNASFGSLIATGGSIDNTPIGATTKSTGAFTSLTVSATVSFPAGSIAPAALAAGTAGISISGNAATASAAATAATITIPQTFAWSAGPILTMSTNPTGVVIQFQNALGTNCGAISTSSSATTYGTSSDADLKIDHGPADRIAALARINQIPVHEAAFREEPDDVRSMLFAHELQRTHPHAVGGNYRDCIPAPVIDEDAPSSLPDGVVIMEQVYQNVDYSKLVVDLIGANQALAAMVDELNSQVAELRSRVN